MSKIRIILSKWKERIKKASGELQRMDGIGSVEKILILAVLIIFMIVFRSQLISLVQWVVQRVIGKISADGYWQ